MSGFISIQFCTSEHVMSMVHLPVDQLTSEELKLLHGPTITCSEDARKVQDACSRVLGERYVTGAFEETPDNCKEPGWIRTETERMILHSRKSRARYGELVRVVAVRVNPTTETTPLAVSV